jgi:hypothetical protein
MCGRLIEIGAVHDFAKPLGSPTKQQSSCVRLLFKDTKAIHVAMFSNNAQRLHAVLVTLKAQHVYEVSGFSVKPTKPSFIRVNEVELWMSNADCALFKEVPDTGCFSKEVLQAEYTRPCCSAQHTPYCENTGERHVILCRDCNRPLNDNKYCITTGHKHSRS